MATAAILICACRHPDPKRRSDWRRAIKEPRTEQTRACPGTTKPLKPRNARSSTAPQEPELCSGFVEPFLSRSSTESQCFQNPRWKQPLWLWLTCVGRLRVEAWSPAAPTRPQTHAGAAFQLPGGGVWRSGRGGSGTGGQVAEWQPEKAHVMFVWSLLCHGPLFLLLLLLFLPSSWPYLAPRRVTQRSG